MSRDRSCGWCGFLVDKDLSWYPKHRGFEPNKVGFINYHHLAIGSWVFKPVPGRLWVGSQCFSCLVVDHVSFTVYVVYNVFPLVVATSHHCAFA